MKKSFYLWMSALVLTIAGLSSCSSDGEENLNNGNVFWGDDILENADTTHLMKEGQLPIWLVDMFTEWENGNKNYQLIHQGETSDETVYYIPDYAHSNYFDDYYHQDGTRFEFGKDKAIPKPVSGWTLIYIWYRKGFSLNQE